MSQLSVRAFPEPRPPHWGEFMWCKWCGGEIPKVIDGKSSTQRLWHPACKDEYFLHTRLEEQFRFLIARDGERCAGCRAEKPMKWGRSEVRHLHAGHARHSFRATAPDMIEWASTLWDPPARKPWGEYTDEDRMIGAQQDIWRTSGLEVDHRVPLWSVAHLPDEERRWYFSARNNCWLLCRACHSSKTKRESVERAALRRFAAAQRTLAL